MKNFCFGLLVGVVLSLGTQAAGGWGDPRYDGSLDAYNWRGQRFGDDGMMFEYYYNQQRRSWQDDYKKNPC